VKALAIVLGVLVLGGALLLLDRLGYLAEPERLELVFENPTLDVQRGQRVVIRPLVEGAPWRRYTFLVSQAEPQPDDPVYPAPHLRAGVEERGEDGGWYRLTGADFVQPLAMSQMGATSIQEWLEEIRLVREEDAQGRSRLLVRAQFGHANGSTVAYYFDPGAPVPAFGWIRQEVMSPEADVPEVHFAIPGGLAPVGEDR